MKQLYGGEVDDQAITQKQLDVLYIVEDHVRALSQISFLTKEHESLHALTVDKTKKLEEEMEKFENVGKLL